MIDPTAVIGLTADEQATVGLLSEQLDAKTPRNLIRSAYYDGKTVVSQVSNIIPPQYYQLGLVLGWSGKAVDLLARRCNIDGFDWADGDLDSLGMAELNREGRLLADFSQGMNSSLIHATSFLIVTEGDDAVGESKALVHVKDALNCTGTWSKRTRSLTDALSVVSRGDDGLPDHLALYLDGLTVQMVEDRGTWRVDDRQDHNLGVPVEPMVYKPRVGREFGSSRISRPVMSAQNAATRTIIRLEGHSDVFSIPQLMLLGAKADLFTNTDGSTKKAWEVALGRVFVVPDDEDDDNPQTARADVKRFDAASPAPHLEALKQQAELFAGETSIPITSLGIAGANDATSAESYLASREDLVSEAEGATDDWNPAIVRTTLRALQAMNGLESVPDDWRSLTTKVRSPIHTSRASAADAGTKIAAAVPGMAETEVGLELMGLTQDQIRRFLAEKRRGAGRDVLAALRERGGLSPAAPAAPVATDDLEQ